MAQRSGPSSSTCPSPCCVGLLFRPLRAFAAAQTPLRGSGDVVLLGSAHAKRVTSTRCCAVAAQIRDGGLDVRFNVPLAGSLVPSRFHGRDRRVRSLIIEVRRDVYVKDATGRDGWLRGGAGAGEHAARERGGAGAGVGSPECVAPFGADVAFVSGLRIIEPSRGKRRPR